MLVVAAVIMLILVGVGIFLLFRGNAEESKRARERYEAQQLVEEEDAQQQNDFALEELRAEAADLKSCGEAMRVGYEAELEQ